MESKLIETRHGQLHVEVRGAGPAILCWPSLYGDARTLDPAVEDLARDHRVVVVDGPGHGGSPAPARPLSFADCADGAIDVLDALGIARATWFGPAWGGHVGVVAARRHRDRLVGLVILNAPMGVWRGKNRMLMRLSHSLLWLFGPRSFVAGMVANKMISKTAADRERLVRVLTDALRRCDRRGLLLAVSYAIAREDLVPTLPEVTVPTLFFAGIDDELFPVGVARDQATRIPDCRFVEVERSSHHSALEAPGQVMPVLRTTLASWEARDTAPGSRTAAAAGPK